MKKLPNFITFITILIMATVTSCMDQPKSTDRSQSRATEAMVAESNRQLGLPNINKFTEKRYMKLIYELRDKESITYSYFMNRDGKLIFLCNSIGYGIPASVQYVSPKKLVKLYQGTSSKRVAMPQPEPNGMFMPDSLDATYVLCSINGKVKPVYTEPKIIVSPFKLKAFASLIPAKKASSDAITKLIKRFKDNKVSKPSTVN